MAINIKVLTVSDIHASQRLYSALFEAVTKHKPDIVAAVGDFLDGTGERKGKLTVHECAGLWASLRCAETVFVRGDHEDSAWWMFAEAFAKSGRELHLLDGGVFTFGPLVVVGFPYLTFHGTGIGPDLPANPDNWLPKLLPPYQPAAKTLWLMHEPPYWTEISERLGPKSGHVEWRLAIERFNPRLVVFGHDHATPLKLKRWTCHLGATTCVNVGQTDSTPLRYAVVQLRFPQNSPSLPTAIKITSYPDGKSAEVRP